MKMWVKTQNGEYGSESRITVDIETKEGKKHFSIGEGEPEDMVLFRDLSDALSVPDMIRLAYEAGRTGENLDIHEVTYDYGEDPEEN